MCVVCCASLQLLRCSYVNKAVDFSRPRLRAVHYWCIIRFGAELVASPATNYAVSRCSRQCIFISLVGATKLWHRCRYDWFILDLVAYRFSYLFVVDI